MGKIKTGLRILYKDGNSPWKVGIVDHGNAEINEQGVWIPIVPIEFTSMDREDVPYIQYAEVNNIFTDAQPLQQWVKKEKDYYMTKEDYIENVTKAEDFDKKTEIAYFTDGEYIYYPVSRFIASWIMKQPFTHIVRSN